MVIVDIWSLAASMRSRASSSFVRLPMLAGEAECLDQRGHRIEPEASISNRSQAYTAGPSQGPGVVRGMRTRQCTCCKNAKMRATTPTPIILDLTAKLVWESAIIIRVATRRRSLASVTTISEVRKWRSQNEKLTGPRGARNLPV
jgi:hypothetical protein